MLLLAAMCWGFGNVANKTALQHIGPFSVVALRCAIAALLLGILACAQRGPAPDRDWLRSTVVLSLFFVAALTAQQIAYLTATVTNASFLVNSATVLVPLVAWGLYGYRPGRVLVLAAAVTLTGVYLMSGIRLPLQQVTPGDLWCLVSAGFYAVWTVCLGQHAVTHGRPLMTTAVQFALAAGLVLPLALWSEGLSPAAALSAWRELLMLGVVATALAFGLMAWAQRDVAASTAAMMVSAESVFGAGAAIQFLGERPSPWALFGAGLILSAILLVATTDSTPAPVARRRGFRSGGGMAPATDPALNNPSRALAGHPEPNP